MDFNDPLLVYKIGVSLIPNIGSAHAKKLIAYTGSVEAIFSEKKQILEKIPGIGEFLASRIVQNRDLTRAEEELEFISKHNIKPYFYLDKEYPSRLRECQDAPVLFYAKGNIDFNRSKILSVVGTRKPTQNGIDICTSIIGKLTNHKPIIVSGLAYGIDITAHKAALKNQLDTIAVLAHGLHTIYPQIHRDTANNICQQGAIISEFMSQAKPDPQNFVKRNRIVAGLADATIVIESGTKGGSLITADIANSYNRDVFAVPGRINDEMSKGCNKLIKTNKAALLESEADIEYLLGWSKEPASEQTLLFEELSEESIQVIKLLKHYGQLELDFIAMKLKLPVNQLSGLLLKLEFKGMVKALPGKVFSIR